MEVIVVFESHGGNTASVARAIADGFGPDARVLTTDEATPTVISDADLIIAGAPVMAFNLPRHRRLAPPAGTGPARACAPLHAGLARPIAGRARAFCPIRDRAPLVAGWRTQGHQPQ